MSADVRLLDVVALTTDLPDHDLHRGEIGTVVECHTDDAFEVEFVARDGYTYALVALHSGQILPLRQKREHSDPTPVPAAL